MNLKFSAPVFLSLGILVLSGQAFPQTKNTLRQLSVTQLKNGLYLEALHTLNDAIRYEPRASDLYFFRGYAKYGLDDFIGAEADYTHSLELFPYQPEVLVNRAIVRSQQQKFTEAFTDLNRALELDSTDASIYLNRARISLSAKRFDECINDCYQVIRLDDSDELVYLLKGSAEMGLGNHYTALSSFQKVVQKNPGNPYGFVQLGATWMELEQPDSALGYFDRAIGLDSANVYTLFNRALAKAHTQDKQGALADLNQVILLSPLNSYAYFNRAVILSELKQRSAAIRDLSTVIRLNPEHLISFYYRGLLRMEHGDLSGAMEDFSKTVELYPDYADGYMARSEAKGKLKDRKGAAADHQLAMEIARRNQNRPDTLDFDEQNYLKNLIRLTGSFEEMNTLTSKVQNQYIDIQLSPVFHLFFGQAPYDKIELYDSYPKEHYFTSIISLTNRPYLMTDSARREMIAHQTILLDSVSRNPESYLIRAVTYTGLKEYRLSINDCDSALNLDPGFVLLYFARANACYGLYQQQTEESKTDQLPAIGEPQKKELDSLRTKELARILESILVDYKKVNLLDPEFPFSYYNRGVVLASLGRYHEALADFRRATELKKNFAEGHYNLGLIHLLLKEKQPGCRNLSRAGELGIADAYRVMKRFCYD